MSSKDIRFFFQIFFFQKIIHFNNPDKSCRVILFSTSMPDFCFSVKKKKLENYMWGSRPKKWLLVCQSYLWNWQSKTRVSVHLRTAEVFVWKEELLIHVCHLRWIKFSDIITAYRQCLRWMRPFWSMSFYIIPSDANSSPCDLLAFKRIQMLLIQRAWNWFR